MASAAEPVLTAPTTTSNNQQHFDGKTVKDTVTQAETSELDHDSDDAAGDQDKPSETPFEQANKLNASFPLNFFYMLKRRSM